MIVVTGASGFIGSRLVDALRAGGTEVVGVDRRAAGHDDGRHLVAELSAPNDAVFEVLRRADAVVHLAGKPGVRDRAADIDAQRRRDNVLATRAVLRAVPAATPIVVASSSSVYGGAPNGRPSREDDVLAPGGGYALSKVRAENWCQRRRAEGGHVTIVRPFTVVGPGQRDDMALARWIAAAAAGRPLDVFGSLQRRRDFTDVRFTVSTLIALLDHPPTVVNIGSGRSRPLADLVDAIGDVIGEAVVRCRPVPVPEPDETLADTHRLRSIVGDIPATDLRRIVADHVGVGVTSRATPEPLIA
ncbi:MAG: NAD(P)-dependent oxidoreductase [Actinomycetota bacterium]|nr:NAD(P)-dependent oxidoreductase [Actinomycetota bacterium]